MSGPGGVSGNRLTEAVAAERRAVEEILGRLDTEGEVSQPAERRRLVAHLVERLTAHAAARRNVLYPRVGQDVPDGDSLVDLAVIGLDQIERTSGEIAGLSGAEPTFEPLVAKLAVEIEEHFDDEENDVLPPLVDAVGPDGADELGDLLTRAGTGVAPA